MEVNLCSENNEFNYYEQGVAFEQAMERCFGEKNSDGSFTCGKNGEIFQLTAPTIVNGAFACEMFLKSMLVHYNLQAKGHDLYKLFIQLPENVRKDINQMLYGNNSSFKIENQLKRHAKDFIDIRYYIEHQGFTKMSPTAIFTLAFNLKTIAKIIISSSKDGEEKA